MSQKTLLDTKYYAKIAPLVRQNEYRDLMRVYEKEGKLPKRLEIGGMIIDDNVNLNHWMVPKEELENIANQLKNKQIRADHSDSVYSIIGRVEDAWVEDNKVFYKGEIGDEELIKKVLLGYVNFDSIQLYSDDVYCANCLYNNHKQESEAKITNINEPCPHCGNSELVIKNPQVVELSLVATPAYTTAELIPLGFKASLDKALQGRFNNVSNTATEITPEDFILVAATTLTIASNVINMLYSFM